jgi:Flp pilus assembly pilin Flp
VYCVSIWRAGQQMVARQSSVKVTRQLTCARHFVDRFVREDAGQDVVEYALLAAFIGVVGYLALSGIVTQVFNTYTSWDDPSTGVPSLWEPPAPAGS